MKYCLFDGGDVVGPFTAEQLLHRPGFGAHSLVCPEEYSDEEAYWKEARAYEEFGFEPKKPSPLEKPLPKEEEFPSDKFLDEMNQAMTEISSIKVEEKTPSPAQAQPQPAASEDKKAATLKSAPAPAPAEPKKEPSSPAENAAPKAEAAAPVKAPSSEKKKEEPPVAKKDNKKPSISSILLRESEEMKRQRVARAAVTEAEKQKKAGHLPPISPNKEAAPSPSEPKGKEEKPVSEKSSSKKTAPKAEDAFAAAVEKVTHTSSVSPIEEYFNTIKSGDLGNILGIPDPKENSDMNLARALESQFAKTDPALPLVGEKEEEDPFDEFTTDKKEPEEKIDESLFEPTPAQADKQTEENLMHSLPDLKSAQALPLVGQTRPPLASGADTQPTLPSAEDTQPPSVQEMIVPEQEDDPNDKTVKTILEGKLKVDTLRQEIPEPIKEVPPEPDYTPHHKAEQVVPNDEYVVKKPAPGKMKFVFLFLGLCVLLFGAYLNWTHEEAVQTPQEQQEQASLPVQPQPEVSVPDARAAINAVAEEQEVQDPLELAKDIVKNYQLGKGRGTVEEYLNKLYAKQLKSGYAAMWSAEPLHRNSYVVKYRLAKTRKEPIVYIFQADTAKKKLTGALNNITLDLVGKIS